jgi:antitoxin (DNA-binding transcriptional repressor) of toxin-antitoxin stability system
MSATDVARNFSAVVSRVGAGEEIEIVRNGAPVAELRPPSRPRGLGAAEWRALIDGLPAVDEDFARDLAAIRSTIGPPVGKWQRS